MILVIVPLESVGDEVVKVLDSEVEVDNVLVVELGREDDTWLLETDEVDVKEEDDEEELEEIMEEEDDGDDDDSDDDEDNDSDEDDDDDDDVDDTGDDDDNDDDEDDEEKDVKEVEATLVEDDDDDEKAGELELGTELELKLELELTVNVELELAKLEMGIELDSVFEPKLVDGIVELVLLDVPWIVSPIPCASASFVKLINNRPNSMVNRQVVAIVVIWYARNLYPASQMEY